MKRTEIDMLNGSLADKIVLFALPLAASSVLQQLFNAADLAVVGRFASSVAMAAVGSNASVISLIVNLFLGLSVGANVLIAKLIGAGKRDLLQDAIHTVISLALICGAALAVIGFFIAPSILKLMGAPENVISLATIYLRIYFVGMPVILIYNYGSAILRSKGDSRRPFLALAAAGVVNVLLNLLFVIVFHLHVIGVALATVLSNCLSAGLVLWFLMNEEDPFTLHPSQLRLRRDYEADLMRIGLPAGLQGMVFSVSNVVIQSAINSFGAACIAGNTAAQNIDFISYCVINAFTQAALTFTSQNYGASRFDRIKKVFRLSLGIGLTLDLIVLGLLILFRYPIMSLFTTDPEVLHFAMIRFNSAVRLHFIIAFYEISGGAIRGMNHSLAPAMISILGTCAFRLIYVLTIFPHFNTPEMLLYVYPFSWILTAIAMLTCYHIVFSKESGRFQ